MIEQIVTPRKECQPRQGLLTMFIQMKTICQAYSIHYVYTECSAISVFKILD